MKPNYVRVIFHRNGHRYTMFVTRQDDRAPEKARIIIMKRYWDDTGGWKGWETIKIYDREFVDWNYAKAVYEKIMNDPKNKF